MRNFFPGRTKGSLFLIVFIIFIFSSGGCSKEAPSISYGAMELVYYETDGGPQERYSLFVIPQDDDGIEDLSELRLYHDWEGLRWTIPAEEWVSYEADGQTWVGSRGIAMEGGEALPRGQYRVELVDKGGERSERTLSFDAPETPRHPFPYLSIHGAQYQIDSQYPQHYFVCYTQDGSLVGTIPVNSLVGRVRDLRLPPNTKGVSLWAEDEEYFTSALTRVMSID